MMRMLMIVALLASLVLLSMEKHQEKAGPQRVEVLRMAVASLVVARVVAIGVEPPVQVLPTASFRSTAERSCSTRWAMPSTATAA